jgi:hypothetical protein
MPQPALALYFDEDSGAGRRVYDIAFTAGKPKDFAIR